jgi:cysteine synthase A
VDGTVRKGRVWQAIEHIEALIGDSLEPVVMFALEWCEFCWSLRRLFAAAGIEYRSVDLDSSDYRNDDWGGEIRKALARKAGTVTIPQIFVGGEHMSGAMETFDAFNSGELRRRLENLNIQMQSRAIQNAYPTSNDRAKQLPVWLHRYNWHRPHGSLKSKPPISRLDMTSDNLLRLHI